LGEVGVVECTFGFDALCALGFAGLASTWHHDTAVGLVDSAATGGGGSFAVVMFQCGHKSRLPGWLA
jgi:hypothetical protein